MTGRQIERLKGYINAQRNESQNRARFARENKHYDLEKFHLQSVRVATEILTDLEAEKP
jgi:hypothetical protein